MRSLAAMNYLYDALRGGAADDAKTLIELADGTARTYREVFALAEKISALMTTDYLEKRAKRGSLEKFDAALSRVRERKPPDYDSE